MRFIFKLCIVIAIIFVFVPIDQTERVRLDQSTKHQGVSFFEAIGMMRIAYDDASTFCERNLALCEKGSILVDIFLSKIRSGVRLLNNKLSDDPVPTDKQEIKH